MSMVQGLGDLSNPRSRNACETWNEAIYAVLRTSVEIAFAA
jgi:hypothetical protein